MPNYLIRMRGLFAGVAMLSLVLPSVSQACTSLLYTDANGAPYAGRTLELSMELPYQVAYFPSGTKFGSKADQHHVLDFDAKHAFVAIGVIDPTDKKFKAIQGVNDKGLTFSMLSYPDAEGPENTFSKNQAVLAAIDLGAWTMAQFDTVEAVKAELERQPVLVTNLFSNIDFGTPFHYTLHDASGKSIVIEFSNGKQNVYDNPVGVMTNGPDFPWHMTNLNNYTFMNNKDHSTTEINGVKFQQPDSGIALAGLPSSNTSVGRFLKAVYYSRFAEKVDNPERALITLAHIMNNFDRPRGITIDKQEAKSIEGIPIPEVAGEPGYSSEFTTWTTLTDLKNPTMYVKTYNNINYARFDLSELKELKSAMIIDLQKLTPSITNGSDLILKGN